MFGMRSLTIEGDAILSHGVGWLESLPSSLGRGVAGIGLFGIVLETSRGLPGQYLC